MGIMVIPGVMQAVNNGARIKRMVDMIRIFGTDMDETNDATLQRMWKITNWKCVLFTILVSGLTMSHLRQHHRGYGK